jgi:ribonuclease BN (tRNA processing enzyme)
MRIIIAGSSHGVPEPHRGCSCTFIEVQGRYYIFDMGLMVHNELVNRGISINDVKAAFFTHMHGDHTNGLIPFLDLISWYYKAADPVIHLPDTACVEVIRKWILCTLSTPMKELEFKRIEAGLIYDDGFLKVTAIPTQHCALSYAFLVEAEGKTVLLTGDIRSPGIDFPTVAFERELDLVIAEAAHFMVEDYLDVFQKCHIKSVCINHYSQKRIGGFVDLQKAMTPIPVCLATDGLEFRL